MDGAKPNTYLAGWYILVVPNSTPHLLPYFLRNVGSLLSYHIFIPSPPMVKSAPSNVPEGPSDSRILFAIDFPRRLSRETSLPLIFVLPLTRTVNVPILLSFFMPLTIILSAIFSLTAGSPAFKFLFTDCLCQCILSTFARVAVSYRSTC